MKRFVIAIFILSILLSTYFIPVIKRSETTIKASIIDVSIQLNKAERWKLWHKPLKQAYKAKPSGYVVINNYRQHRFAITTAQFSYHIANPNAGEFEIEVLTKNRKSCCRISLSVLPASSFTKVLMETETRLFNTFFPVGKKGEICQQLHEELKEFMETPSLYYGFPIQSKGVVDTNVAVLKNTVASNEKFAALPGLLKDLNHYASTNKLTVLQPPMLQFQQIGEDSLQVVMMLAINKTGPIHKRIICRKMPANGRMLVGRFKGKFKDRTQLNAALEKYILDNNLETLVNSYEKYYSYPLPTGEVSEVDLEIYYPIL